jgi:hypothetical protein
MVYWNPAYGILTPYLWYIEPHGYGILTTLLIVCQAPCLWYCDPFFVVHVYRTPYPLYIEPSAYILTPYLLYIEHPFYGIS